VLVLALDTSTPATTVAVARDGEVVEEQTELGANRHGEVLAPLVDRVLRGAGVERADLELVAVGVGPGPFTGLRVGLVTAAGLADALGIAVRGVCSLDAVAHADDRPWSDGFTVVTDARRKEIYWASYADGRRVEGPAVERPDVVAERLGPTAMVGFGAQLYSGAFSGQRIDERSPYPRAGAVAALALDDAWSVAPQPMYLRRPDARPPGAPKRVTPA